MGTDIELIKVGGLITTNSMISIDGGNRPSLELLAEALQERIRDGRKIVLVPSAHKFEGYGVTDYLENPLSVVSFLNSLTDDEFGRLRLDSPELRGLRGMSTEGSVPPLELLTSNGLDRYSSILFNWHRAKAKEFGVESSEVSTKLYNLCKKVGDRVEQLYNRMADLRGVDPTDADSSSIVRDLQVEVERMKIAQHTHLLDSSVIHRLTGDSLRTPENIQRMERYLRIQLYGLEARRAMDRIITSGEPLSAILISQYLANRGINNYQCNSDETGIVTNRQFGSADILLEPTRKIIKDTIDPLVECHDVVIVPGFSGTTFRGIENYLIDNLTVDPDKIGLLVGDYKEQRANNHLSITQLGRGGSESSAAVLAGCLGIETSCWVKTDVGGVLTAKPDSVIPCPLTITGIDYRTAIETGAIQQRAVELAEKFGLEVIVTDIADLYRMATQRKSTKGTVISSDKAAGGFTGPVLETGEPTYFIAEVDAKYLVVYNIKNRAGELGEVLRIPAKYGVNLAETMHHLSDTFFIFNQSVGGLQKAADELTRLGYSCELGDCAYFRLVGSHIPLGIKQQVETTIRSVLPQTENPLYIGAWTDNTNAVTLAVRPQFKAQVKTALYGQFILNR